MLFKFKNANKYSDEYHSWFNTDQIVSVTEQIKKGKKGYPLIISFTNGLHEKVYWSNLCFYFDTEKERSDAFLNLCLLMNNDKEGFVL